MTSRFSAFLLPRFMKNVFRKLTAPLIAVSLVMLLSACSSQQQVKTSASIIVFGTVVDITVYSDDRHHANQAIAEVENRFQTLHKEWHAWEQGGIVSKINHAIATHQAIEVSESVKAFILKSQQLTRDSLGYFDPGIGKLIKLWGFHQEQWQGPPPSEQAIQNWLEAHPSIQDIRFENQLLLSDNDQVQLDFGANAKGLAMDIAMQTLHENGIDNALVSIGGDMKARGSKNGLPWQIGIESPENPAIALAKVALQDNESIVTSGDYQRYFEWQGKRYAHIIDPKTGYPADSFSSVTVIHPDATTADAAATAILVAGPQNWLHVAEKMGITQVLCIEHDGQILQTPKMADRIEFIN